MYQKSTKKKNFGYCYKIVPTFLCILTYILIAATKIPLVDTFFKEYGVQDSSVPLTEKASIPQVLEKADQLKTLVDTRFWDNPSVEKPESLRMDHRDLMQFLDGGGKKSIDVDIDVAE